MSTRSGLINGCEAFKTQGLVSSYPIYETSSSLSLSELIEYTDWERGKWHEWLRQRGDGVLATSAGPHGDGRFQTVGDLVRHIFSAEKRYIDRLSNRPLTDGGSIPNGNVEALFQFARQSRMDLKELIKAFPTEDWDVPQDFTLMNNFLRATPRNDCCPRPDS